MSGPRIYFLDDTLINIKLFQKKLHNFNFINKEEKAAYPVKFQSHQTTQQMLQLPECKSPQETEPFDLFLMDRQLGPGILGNEIAKSLKESGYKGQIILYSDDSDFLDPDKGQPFIDRGEVDAVVYKQLRREDLILKMLQQYLPAWEVRQKPGATARPILSRESTQPAERKPRKRTLKSSQSFSDITIPHRHSPITLFSPTSAGTGSDSQNSTNPFSPSSSDESSGRLDSTLTPLSGGRFNQFTKTTPVSTIPEGYDDEAEIEKSQSPTKKRGIIS
jgi:CheY-like chemotaxis protein